MDICINILSFIQTIDDTLFICCILTLIFKNDNRGLHDILSNTYVVDMINYKEKNM